MALSLVAVLNTAIAAAYYLRLIGVMYFRPPVSTARGEGGAGAGLAMGLAAVLVLWVGITPGSWIARANTSSPNHSLPPAATETVLRGVNQATVAATVSGKTDSVADRAFGFEAVPAMDQAQPRPAPRLHQGPIAEVLPPEDLLPVRTHIWTLKRPRAHNTMIGSINRQHQQVTPTASATGRHVATHRAYGTGSGVTGSAP